MHRQGAETLSVYSVPAARVPGVPPPASLATLLPDLDTKVGHILTRQECGLCVQSLAELDRDKLLDRLGINTAQPVVRTCTVEEEEEEVVVENATISGTNSSAISRYKIQISLVRSG